VQGRQGFQDEFAKGRVQCRACEGVSIQPRRRRFLRQIPAEPANTAFQAADRGGDARTRDAGRRLRVRPRRVSTAGDKFANARSRNRRAHQTCWRVAGTARRSAEAGKSAGGVAARKASGSGPMAPRWRG